MPSSRCSSQNTLTFLWHWSINFTHASADFVSTLSGQLLCDELRREVRFLEPALSGDMDLLWKSPIGSAERFVDCALLGSCADRQCPCHIVSNQNQFGTSHAILIKSSASLGALTNLLDIWIVSVFGVGTITSTLVWWTLSRCFAFLKMCC